MCFSWYCVEPADTGHVAVGILLFIKNSIYKMTKLYYNVIMKRTECMTELMGNIEWV
jgi:hypothetical protein